MGEMHKVEMLLETLLKFVDAGCFPSDLSSKDGFAPFLYVQPIIEKEIIMILKYFIEQLPGTRISSKNSFLTSHFNFIITP